MRIIRQPRIVSFSLLQRSRHYLSHTELKNGMMKLGYPPFNWGACHGISCVAAQYLLSQKIDEFDKMVQKIAGSKLDSETTHFLDEIFLSYYPEQYPILQNSAGFSAKNKLQEPMTSFSMIQNEEIKKQGGIQRRDFFSGIYSPTELNVYFKILEKTSRDFPHPFALFICATYHTIVASFNTDKNKWLFINVDTLPVKYCQNYEEIALITKKGLSIPFLKRDEISFATHFFSTAQNEKIAKQFVHTYQNNPEWKKLHSLDVDRKLTSDAKHTWFIHACANGHISEAKALIQAGVNINHHSTNDETALYYAVCHDMQEIVDLLLENGANLTGSEPYLRIAVNFGFYAIAEKLLQHGAKINEGYPSPIFTAMEKGDKKMLELLEKYRKDSDIVSGKLLLEKAGLFGKNKAVVPHYDVPTSSHSDFYNSIH